MWGVFHKLYRLFQTQHSFGQVEEEGTDISSTPSSGDIDMLEGQDQELVTGSGTHLDGVVSKSRTKVKNNNDSKVTVDVLSSRILDYGLLTTKRPVIDRLRLQDHVKR
jgi:hypothetical protein